MQLAIDASSILFCNRPVDFRKAVNGLIDVVLTELQADVHKHIFIFYNRSRNKIKILAWHKNGFVLLLKQLEKGHFFNTQCDTEVMNVTPKQLSWLLAGLDWVSMSTWGELEYRDFH
jgi:transposase